MNDLSRAEDLLDLGRAPEAEQLARQHLLENPSSADGLWVLARSLNKQQRWPEAVDAGRAAMRITPESTHVRITLTDSLLETKQADEARQIAWGSVQIDPHDWRCRYSLAQALLGGRQPLVRDALDQANECVRLAPNSPDAHNLAGLCLDRLGLADLARTAYRKALELDPQHTQAMNNLATLDIGIFRLGRASKGFTSALAIDPNLAIVQENLKVIVWRLAMRLFLAILAAALVVGILLASSDAWLPRAATGVVLIGLCLWLAESSRRHLPRGISRSWRALAGQLDVRGWCYALFDAFALVCVCFMAFAPHSVAVGFGLTLLVVLRLASLLLIGGAVVAAVLSLFRRGDR